MDQSFNMIYFKGGTYEQSKQLLDQASQSIISDRMNFYMNLYLQKVRQQMQLYKTENIEQSQYYIDQLIRYLEQFYNAGQQFNNYKKFSINLNWAEYHKKNFISRILYDSHIYETIMKINKQFTVDRINYLIEIIRENKNNKIEYCCDIEFERQVISIRTHQDLMKNWLQYSQCEDIGMDEVMDFERRLEKAISGLPENEKQQPTLPKNWEQLILLNKK